MVTFPQLTITTKAMTPEERKKYLYEQTRKIQKDAARLNAALEKKEHEEVKKRLQTEKRKSNEEDSLSHKEAIRALRLPEEKLRSINDIIKDGTPRERAAIAIIDYDLLNTSDERVCKLSEKELKQLRAAILKESIDEQNEFMYYIREANKIFRFASKLTYNFKMYQLEATLLAQLVTKWEDYEREAEACNKFLNAFLRDIKNGAIEVVGVEDVPSFFAKMILADNCKEWDKATLVYDEATQTFKANVDGEGKLYEEIKKQVKDTEEYLSYFKGSAIAMAEYIEEVDLPVTPIQVYDVITNAEEELYSGSLIESKKYYRSNLNKKKQNGESISPEEERRAVFPDYHEMAADEHSYSYMSGVLHNSDN